MAAQQPFVSEDDFVQSLLAPLARGYGGAFGLRDDAAVISMPPGENLVVTTDTLVAGVHFFPDDPPDGIAAKALGVNVSDLAGKGAQPLAFQLSLALTAACDRPWLTAFVDGLRVSQTGWGLHLSGGDTVRTPGPLTISVTAFGCVPENAMIKRADAQVGDCIYVTGTLGDSALGLALRSDREQAARWSLDAATAEALVSRYLRPQPRIELIPALRRHASAAMDISDGLVKDLGRLCAASGRGARVDIGAVPLSPAANQVLTQVPDAMETILTGGDDYEILAAIPVGAAQGFEQDCGKAGQKVQNIGTICAEQDVAFLDADGRAVTLSGSGYDHF